MSPSAQPLPLGICEPTARLPFASQSPEIEPGLFRLLCEPASPGQIKQSKMYSPGVVGGGGAAEEKCESQLVNASFVNLWTGITWPHVMKLCTNESLGGNTMSCVASPHRTWQRGVEASGRAQSHAQVASLQFCARGKKRLGSWMRGRARGWAREEGRRMMLLGDDRRADCDA
jgi:hypothetical protein